MSPSPEAARILHVLIAREPDLWRRERRCRALLADELPDFPAEHVALRRSLALGIPGELLSASKSEPSAVLLARLGAALQSSEAMRSDLAEWAVNTWAAALGVVAAGRAGGPQRKAQEQVARDLAWQSVGSANSGHAEQRATPQHEEWQTVSSVPVQRQAEKSHLADTASGTSRNPWPWALAAGPFLVLGVVWALRAINEPQYELESLWITATTRQTAFLAWYLPPALLIAFVAWLLRRRRG